MSGHRTDQVRAHLQAPARDPSRVRRAGGGAAPEGGPGVSVAQLAGVDELKELLDRNQEVLIFGHKDADGDTLGCSLAFAEALRARGKGVYVVIPPPLPDKYSWMPGFDQIVEGPPPDADVHLVLFFDAGNIARSGSAVEQIHDHATVVNVDHHTSNSRFGAINIIDPDAAAVGQM